MSAFFIVDIEIPNAADRAPYDAYIEKVKPVVEAHGGTYLVRSEAVTAFAGGWQPDRVIVIRFEDRAALDSCFASPEYRAIMGLRENTVHTRAVIVED